MNTRTQRHSVRWWLIAGMCGLLSMLGARSELAAVPAPATRPLVGAIRFDAWQSGESPVGDDFIAQLGPRQWRYRLPSFGTEISDTQVRMDEATQANMDQEIALAKAAGIDYWAFNHYLTINRRCLNLYLSSARKSDVKFCLQMGAFFDARAADALNLMKDPSYQRVAGGRPLVYAQTWYMTGDPAAVKPLIDNFRAQAIAAGLQNPYIVSQNFDGGSAATWADYFGLDAIGSYAQGVRGPSFVENSFATLASNSRADWDAYRNTGRQVIPTVMTGWDPRPDPSRLSEPYFGYATPQQISAHLQDAINWCAANPGAVGEANTIQIYAWDEITEGGWLVPGNPAFNSVGNGRLDAIAAVLLGTAPPPPPSPPSPSQFNIGDRVSVINGAHSVRLAPDSSSPKVAWIPEGAVGTVVGGPVGDLSGSVYYQVRWDDAADPTGWAYDFTLGLVASSPSPSGGDVYLSDLPWTYSVNSYGPVERDMSNGYNGAGDGWTITLNGVTYPKGLGVAPYSEVRYALGGQYSTFLSDVGVDDSVGDHGSLVFQVWADGVKLYDSGLMYGPSATQSINVSVAGKQELRLIVTTGGDGGDWDHADWAGARLTQNPTSAGTVTYVSDLSWTSMTNAWGPVERDRSNGQQGAGDGHPLTLNGIVYAKGLGAHDYSEVRYALGGQYASFLSDVGVDDECGSEGSVVFQVWADGVKLYDSGAVTGASATKSVNVSVAGVQELRLIVTDAGDGWAYDHADWAGARLTR